MGATGNELNATAINVKFTHLESREYEMDPKQTHDNPFLFVIDKESFNETLIPSEIGKPNCYPFWGEPATLNVDEFLFQLLD